MYFKVDKKSELGLNIGRMLHRISEAESKMIAVAKDLSDMDDPAIMKRRFAFGGGLFAIQFSTPPGKQWVENSSHTGLRFFHPSQRRGKAMDALRAKFKSGDDKITDHEFCAMFGLVPGTVGDGHRWHSMPTYFSTDSHYYLDIKDEWAATMNPRSQDLQEVLTSEYLEHKKTRDGADTF